MAFAKGDRVRFVSSVPSAELPAGEDIPPGTLGTCTEDEAENSLQGRHVWVRWDSGALLAMLLSLGDRIERAAPEDLLRRFDEWAARREVLSGREDSAAEGDYFATPAPDEWAESDDRAVELLEEFAGWVRGSE